MKKMLFLHACGGFYLKALQTESDDPEKTLTAISNQTLLNQTYCKKNMISSHKQQTIKCLGLLKQDTQLVLQTTAPICHVEIQLVGNEKYLTRISPFA